MDVDELTAIIQTRYPDFKIESVAPIELGQYNQVFTINEAWIFRLPRFAAGLEQLELELTLLRVIAPHLSLPVPQPELVYLDPGAPQRSFAGYRRLSGEPFWPHTCRAITDPEARAGVARQLGQFLRELHHLPITELLDMPLPVSDTKEEWEGVYERIQLHLFPLMRLDSCRETADHFESFLYDQSGRFRYAPQLRHGDFGSSNILFDTRRQQISGVLDFSFTTLGDPAVDFAGLLMYGESFVREMTAVYPNLDSLWPRIRFYKGTFALLEALYGVEHGDDDALQAGLADYV